MVILFFMGFRGALMSVRGAVVQLGGTLMILVMRAVIITSRHLHPPYLSRLCMGFLRKLVSLIRIFHRSLRVPVRRCAIALFVMFRCGTMGVRRKRVEFGRFSVFLVHRVSS
ncbi:MAG: hypothetical protein WDO73_18930 [Ignavibacteriota bacterium]